MQSRLDMWLRHGSMRPLPTLPEDVERIIWSHVRARLHRQRVLAELKGLQRLFDKYWLYRNLWPRPDPREHRWLYVDYGPDALYQVYYTPPSGTRPCMLPIGWAQQLYDDVDELFWDDVARQRHWVRVALNRDPLVEHFRRVSLQRR